MAQRIAHDALEMIEYGYEPSVLVIADSDAGAVRARATAERALCRVSDCIGIEGAADRLDRQVRVDALFFNLERDHGAELDRLMDRAESAARQGRHGAIIAAPVELIDPIAASTSHPRVVHVCGAGEIDRVAGLRFVAHAPGPRLQDVNEGERSRLQQLSEEVGRIAAMLANLSDEEENSEREQVEQEERGGAPIRAEQVRAIIRARRLRDQYFPSQLFADPAWDMLLDLMAARLEKSRVAVSSLCIAAAVPATTALRWIKTLTDQGLFVRTADPQDGRRVFIELSDKAAAGLAAYLRAASRISPVLR